MNEEMQSLTSVELLKIGDNVHKVKSFPFFNGLVEGEVDHPHSSLAKYPAHQWAAGHPLDSGIPIQQELGEGSQVRPSHLMVRLAEREIPEFGIDVSGAREKLVD